VRSKKAFPAKFVAKLRQAWLAGTIFTSGWQFLQRIVKE
jgi:hypothetical protein